MSDTVSKDRRSEIMASVRSRGNRSTERVTLNLLRRAKIIGWRRHLSLPGKPDFAWAGERVALFVDGCFWHGCTRCYRQPKSNVDFWQAKVKMNQRRDRQVCKQLWSLGWSVIRVRECELKTERGCQSVISRIGKKLSEGKHNERAHQSIRSLGRQP